MKEFGDSTSLKNVEVLQNPKTKRKRKESHHQLTTKKNRKLKLAKAIEARIKKLKTAMKNDY